MTVAARILGIEAREEDINFLAERVASAFDFRD